LAADFDAVDQTGDDAPTADHNVAPTKRVLTVVQRHSREGVDLDAAAGDADREPTVRGIRVMRWGLVPHWAKDPKIGYKMINARAETVASKPAYRRSLAHKRCLLPLDGWFEWRRDPIEGTKKVTKTPFFMHRPDGRQLVMAGLWSTWHDPKAEQDAPPLVTCTVITTESIGQLTEVHDRMPLLLAPQAFERWLDPDASDVADLLVPAGDDIVDAIELRPVSDKVNNVRNNGAELVQRIEPAIDLDQPSLFGS
jgi:putative SOS response-associated peptidase YedK